MEAATENRKPLVSVIIPIFNAERFLNESIESVLAQTYTDWELILVDDGSNDGSQELSKYYSDKYSNKITYVSHHGNRNCGVSASRNLGLRIATGKFVNFLDADDIWRPGHLEAYIALLQRHPKADAAFGRSMYWFSWNPNHDQDQQRDFVPPVGNVEVGKTLEGPQLLVSMLLGEIAIPVPCSVIVKRSAIIDIGGFEDRFVGAYEDQVFYSKLFSTRRTVVTDACLDLYRQHPGSLTAASRDRDIEASDRRRFLEWLVEYFNDQGASDPLLWKALNAARWRNEHPLLNRWRSKLSRYLDPMFIVRLLSEKSGSGMSPLAPNVER